MGKVKVSSSITNELNNSEIIVLINNETDFIKKIYDLIPNKNITLIDCWRVLDAKKVDKNIELIQWAKYRGEK